jgi:hypothetical protein
MANNKLLRGHNGELFEWRLFTDALHLITAMIAAFICEIVNNFDTR